MIAVLHDQLLEGSFRPALGNCLLAGDAAGVILPVTFEGISTAVRIGRLAAEAIGRVVDGAAGAAADACLESLRPVIELVGRFKRQEGALAERAEEGAAVLARALAEAYRLADR